MFQTGRHAQHNNRWIDIAILVGFGLVGIAAIVFTAFFVIIPSVNAPSVPPTSKTGVTAPVVPGKASGRSSAIRTVTSTRSPGSSPHSPVKGQPGATSTKTVAGGGNASKPVQGGGNAGGGTTKPVSHPTTPAPAPTARKPLINLTLPPINIPPIVGITLPPIIVG